MIIELTDKEKEALREALKTGFLDTDNLDDIASIEAGFAKLKDDVQIHNLNAMIRARAAGQI